jgi:hypothetical protein
MTDNLTTADLKALACEDCPADVTVQRGRTHDGGTALVVVVAHAGTCPWARRCVPAGGATIVRPDAILRHVRASDAV